MRPAPIAAALVVLALLAQGAAARWSANGDTEPDTPQDLAHGRMFPEPDTSPAGMRVYFDAVYIDTVTSGNPNVGALGSRIITPAALTFGAFLGVWKDCNRDGYIGHAESVMLDYPTALLNDTGVCPAGSRWNRDQIVSEFIHFAPRPNGVNGVPRVIVDTGARVWGDFGRPEVPAIPNIACNPRPLPRGTLDSTGALLMYVDCNASYNVARSINEADEATGLGIGFHGPGGHHRPDTACESPLNQQTDLYGDSPCNSDDPGLFEGRTGRRIVNVWDCDARERGVKALDVRDPTAQPGRRGALSFVPDPATGEPMAAPVFGEPLYITDRDGTYGVPFLLLDGGVYLELDGITPVSPSVNDTDGSLADTHSHVNDGMGGCARVEGDDGTGEPALNGDSSFDPLRGKRRTDFNLTWQNPVAPVVPGLPPAQVRGDTPWANSSNSYGPPLRMPNGLVRQDDLRPVNANWFTFYAALGSMPSSLGASTPHGSTSVYGNEACQGFTSGVHRGWDCDPSHWWSAEYGEPNAAHNARPGVRYIMRDTDCLDGGIARGSGLFASLATLSEDPPCPQVG